MTAEEARNISDSVRVDMTELFTFIKKIAAQGYYEATLHGFDLNEEQQSALLHHGYRLKHKSNNETIVTWYR